MLRTLKHQDVGVEGARGSTSSREVKQFVPVEHVDTRQFGRIPTLEFEPIFRPLWLHVQALSQQLVRNFLKSAVFANCFLPEASENTVFNGKRCPLHTSKCISL